MKKNLKEYLGALFYGEPKTQKNEALFEELYGNMCDRYDELVAQGRAPTEAYQCVIDEMGDISPLIERPAAPQALPPRPEAKADTRVRLEPLALRRAKRNRALCLAAAVMLYILWLVPCILFDAVVPLFVFVAIGTAILVFSSKWIPHYIDDSAITYEAELKERDSRAANLLMAFGVALCILSVVPTTVIDSKISSALLFVLVALGVGMILLSCGICPHLDKGIDASRAMCAPAAFAEPQPKSAKKRKNPWLLPVILVAVVAVLWSGVWMAIKHDFQFGIHTDNDDFHSYTEVGNGTVTEPVDRITVYWVAGEISVKRYDGASIQIKEVSANGEELNKEERVHWGVKDGRLSVRHNEDGPIQFHWGEYPEKRLEILLPVHTSTSVQNVTEISIESMSAPISISGFEGSAMVKSVSGSITLRDGSGNTKIDTVSGDIFVLNRKRIETFEIATVSGNATCQGIEAGVISFDSIDGDLVVERDSTVNGATIDTIDGNAKLESNVPHMTQGIQCNTVSGNLTLVVGDLWYGFDVETDTDGEFISETIPVTGSDGCYHYGREGSVTEIKFSASNGDVIVVPAA